MSDMSKILISIDVLKDIVKNNKMCFCSSLEECIDFESKLTLGSEESAYMGYAVTRSTGCICLFEDITALVVKDGMAGNQVVVMFQDVIDALFNNKKELEVFEKYGFTCKGYTFKQYIKEEMRNNIEGMGIKMDPVYDSDNHTVGMVFQKKTSNSGEWNLWEVK